MENPFEDLIIDCVGPLLKSKSGSQYLLTVICRNSHSAAEAFPLNAIKTKLVLKDVTSFI